MKPTCFRFALAFGIVMLALAAGCGPTSPATGRQPAVGPAVPPTQPVTPVARPVPATLEDRSFSSARYLNLGLPADDRPWASVDLEKALRVLTDLSKTDARQLPQFGSERSGKVFSRLTADDNLDFARNATLPLSVRMADASNYLAAHNAITKLYFAAFLEKRMDGASVLELSAASFRVMVVMTDVVNEFIPTIPKDDLNYATRMAGLQKVKQGCAISTNGALLTLSEREAYRTADRVRLTESLTTTLPRIVPHMLPASRAEVVQKLDDMNANKDLSELQPALGKLCEAVKTAVAEMK